MASDGKLVGIGLGVILMTGCIESYQSSPPSSIPPVSDSEADPPKRLGSVRSGSSLQIQTLTVGRMFPKPDAYVVEIKLVLEASGAGPISIRASGSTDENRGPLGIRNPGTREFTVSSERVPALLLATPGRATTTAQVLVPYEWVFRRGAELTLTITASDSRGRALDEVSREVHVPPPPPPEF